MFVDNQSKDWECGWKEYVEARSQWESLPFYWNSSELRQSFASDLRGVAYCVDQSWVSFILYTQAVDVLEIVYLETLPNKTGCGYMKALLSQFIERNAESSIWLDVHQRNEPALALYGRLGFARAGLRPRYYRDGGDAVLLSYGPSK